MFQCNETENLLSRQQSGYDIIDPSLKSPFGQKAFFKPNVMAGQGSRAAEEGTSSDKRLETSFNNQPKRDFKTL